MIKQDRSIWMYVLLSIVTCGIYGWVFLYGLINDVNVLCAGDGKETPSLIKVILLSIVTCGIYGFIFYYNLGNRIYENAPRYGLGFSENGTSVLMWFIFGSLICGIGPYVGMNIIIKNTNSLAAIYNRNVTAQPQM